MYRKQLNRTRFDPVTTAILIMALGGSGGPALPATIRRFHVVIGRADPPDPPTQFLMGIAAVTLQGTAEEQPAGFTRRATPVKRTL